MAIVALKIETEAEGASFFDIEKVHFLGLKAGIPTFVKIGGPDARTDIRQCKDIGIRGVIAPMVESPFAVEKFDEATRELDFEWRALTIESVTAMRQIDLIAREAAGRGIDGMTFGRGDFAASIGLRGQEDSSKVMTYVETFVKKCRQSGLISSVGGNMRQDSLENIAKMTEPPHRLEGRRGIWNWSSNVENLTGGLTAAINFELSEIDVKVQKLSVEVDQLNTRSQVLRTRLNT